MISPKDREWIKPSRQFILDHFDENTPVKSEATGRVDYWGLTNSRTQEFVGPNIKNDIDMHAEWETHRWLVCKVFYLLVNTKIYKYL